MSDDGDESRSDEQGSRTQYIGDRERRARWLGDAERLVAEVFGEERVAKVKEQAGRAPEVGDAILAAWIDDVRLIEQARFHRARRDLGREVALGRKEGAATATDRMNRAADYLGVLRVQRDAVVRKDRTSTLDPDVEEKQPESTQPTDEHTKAKRLKPQDDQRR